MKKLYKSIVLVSLLGVLTSCDNPFKKYLSSNEYTSINSYNPSLNLENNTNPYSQGKDIFYQYKNSISRSTPSTGNRKILVVPVAFKDQSYSSFGNETKIKNNLEETFFSNDNSYFESVSSFYKKSSYGNLNFSGSVSNIYTTKNNLNYYMNKDASDASSLIADEIVENASSLGINLNDFDTTDNSDSILDCVWMVYLYPHDETGENTFLWAYCYYNFNENNKYIYNYAWASYDFMINEKGNTSVDAHTFIHETGHLLGLDDYYSYDDEPRSPLGLLDMMDGNILDHNAFSKYNLGWVEPIVATTNSTYTLKPFVESGDCLILASNFNGTTFDEYFILEYYTPTSLNELDSTNRYEGRYPLGFSINGLKILHVDQRLGKININVNTGAKSWDNVYLETPSFNIPTNKNPYYSEIISSNSQKYCYGNPYFTLVNLVQASGKTNLLGKPSNSLYSKDYATNSDLFTKGGNVFGKDVYKDYISNEGWKLPSYVNILEMNDQQITIELNSL